MQGQGMLHPLGPGVGACCLLFPLLFASRPSPFPGEPKYRFCVKKKKEDYWNLQVDANVLHVTFSVKVRVRFSNGALLRSIDLSSRPPSRKPARSQTPSKVCLLSQVGCRILVLIPQPRSRAAPGPHRLILCLGSFLCGKNLILHQGSYASAMSTNDCGIGVWG